MKVGIAQINPEWLNKKATSKKIVEQITVAGKENCELLVFGEAFLPGYPFWLAHTGGAQFDEDLQKEMFAIYHAQAIDVQNGEDLNLIRKACKDNKLAIYLGLVEKSTEQSGFTLFCTLVYINEKGRIASTHRKLVPTYEERLVWGNGDGHGLQAHPLGSFKVGGLNCWENWMPLSRTALYAQGESLHIAVWPGSDYNTKDITRFIARESRSYVISASSLLFKESINPELPVYDLMVKNAPAILANGGSCIAKPNGEWLIEPVIGKEELILADLDIKEVARERQNFDPTGHYSRADVLSLNFNDERQTIIKKD